MQTANKLEEALLIAFRAHYGQTDAAGQPYLLHPLRMMFKAEGELRKILCLLHDVVEDSNYTATEISFLFGVQIAKKLKLLTHDKETPYLAYIEALQSDIDARHVKGLDLFDNLSRVHSLDVTSQMHFFTKYGQALAVLAKKA